MERMPVSIADKMMRAEKDPQECKGFKVLRNSSFAGSFYSPIVVQS